MATATLKLADVKKILDFTYLDPYDVSYHKKVLSLMKTHYSWNLVVYTRWSHEGNITSFFSIGLKGDFIFKIHQHYVLDNIRRFVAEQHISNSWNGIFYSQATDLFHNMESNALAFLQEHNIYYFAIMFLSNDPNEHYVLCKTKTEGPFSEKEKTVLEYLLKPISRNVSYRSEHQRTQNALTILNKHFDKKETGLILVDEEWNILNFNDNVFSMVPRSLNLTQITEITSYIKNLFQSSGEQNPEIEKEQLRITNHGHRITLEEVSLLNEERKQKSYFLITITRNRNSDLKLNPAVSARYNLTERELQISELLINGYSNKNIAEALHISLSTVKIHISNIFRKLSVHNRMDAILKLTKNS